MLGLQDEQFAQVTEILRHLDEFPVNSEESNRRGSARVIFRRSLLAILIGSDDPAPIRIYSRNLSVGGIGFVSRRFFKIGERAAMSLRLREDHGKLMLAQVVFGRYLRKGLYEMGAKFVDSIPDPSGAAPVPRKWHYIPEPDSSSTPLPPAEPPVSPAPPGKPAPTETRDP